MAETLHETPCEQNAKEETIQFLLAYSKALKTIQNVPQSVELMFCN